MSEKIWSFIGLVCATFPIIFIFPLEWWVTCILIMVIIAVQIFSPIISTVIQGVSWIVGFVFFFISSYQIWVYIIAVIAFLWWGINQIYFYSLNRLKRY